MAVDPRRLVEPLRPAQAPVAADAIESLAGETFLLTVPAAIVAVVMAGHGGQHPGSASGREWVLVAFTGIVTAGPLLLFAYAAQRVPVHAARRAAVPRPDDQPGLGWVIYDESMPATGSSASRWCGPRSLP